MAKRIAAKTAEIMVAEQRLTYKNDELVQENVITIKKSTYQKQRNTYYFNSDILSELFKFLFEYKKPW